MNKFVDIVYNFAKVREGIYNLIESIILSN